MRFAKEGIISLYAFVTAVAVPFCVVPVIQHFFSWSKLYTSGFSLFLSYGIVNAVYCVLVNKTSMQVVIRASFLGTVFFAGIYISDLGVQNWKIFGWYVCVLSFFHYSEYLSIALTNPKTLTIDAFMLNHSLAYGIAASASWIEFFIENHFVPKLKGNIYISIGGVALCVMGELLRKSAMFTASTNFNHIVQTVKERDHVLITHGVYSLCRHPSYVGWFYWSIGTQLILVNPFCIIIYTIASWLFFKTRILIEEEALLNFFGDDYINYKKKVPSGIPFNNGVQFEE